MNTATTSSSKAEKPKRGRPALFDPDRVVEQVADLFWARGYDGVSMSDITAATGLSKSSLYNSFGGKDALFKAAFKRYNLHIVQAGADWLAADDGSDPMDKLDQLLSGPAQDVHERDDVRGCFLCNTSADDVDGTPAIDALVRRGFRVLEVELVGLFTRHAPKADPHTIRDAARMALTTYVGLRIRSRTRPAQGEFDSVRRATVAAVTALLDQT